jgi:hypothetical protein
MPRYFFHLVDFSGSVTEDEEGSDLPSLTVARDHALDSLRELVAAAVRGLQQGQIEMIVVADEEGRQLAAIPFIVALPPKVAVWLKTPEKVVPKDRFEQYRRNADDCRAQADSAANSDDQSSWLKLAHAWLQMLPASQPAATDVAGRPAASDDDSQASH